MNAVLDRRAECSESPTTYFGSNDPSGIRNSRSQPKPVRMPARRDETTGRSQAGSMLLQTTEGLFSTVVAGALLCVSVSFSILLIAAMLVVFLCGLACYS